MSQSNFIRICLMLFILKCPVFAELNIDMLCKRTYELKDEIPRNVAGEWLGICRTAEGDYLSPVIVSMPTERTEGEITLSVKGENCNKRLIVFRGLTLERKRLLTGSFDRTDPFTITGSFQGQSFTIKEISQGESGYRLEIAIDNVRQVIFSVDRTDDVPKNSAWNVEWAGDLDGDKKLDLVLRATDTYAGFERRLFFSGSAKNGEAMALVSRCYIASAL